MFLENGFPKLSFFRAYPYLKKFSLAIACGLVIGQKAGREVSIGFYFFWIPRLSGHRETVAMRLPIIIS